MTIQFNNKIIQCKIHKMLPNKYNKMIIQFNNKIIKYNIHKLLLNKCIKKIIIQFNNKIIKYKIHKLLLNKCIKKIIIIQCKIHKLIKINNKMNLNKRYKIRKLQFLNIIINNKMKM